MGLKAGALILFPVTLMIIAILLNQANAGVPNPSGGVPVTICNPNQQTNCAPRGIGTSYYCEPTSILGFLQACQILPACNIEPPAPAFCIPGPLEAIAAGCALQFATSGAAGCPVFLPAGASVFIGSATIGADLNTAGMFFGFTSSGTSGLISIIGISVGLACLAGLSVFGSGESAEAIHALLIGGILLGFWLFLAGLEGFAGGSSTSMFASLNQAIQGIGTFFYVILTFMYVMGFVGTISRGGG